MALKLTNRAYG